MDSCRIWRSTTAGSRRRSGALVTEPIDGGPGLEADEPVLVLERADQDIDRTLRRNQRQRRRHVPANPDVFVLVVHEIGERVDHLFAVADEHLSRGGLEQAVPQQRDEGRDEEEVAGAQLSGGADRFACDVERRVEHQRHEQRVATARRQLAERARDFEAGRVPPVRACPTRAAAASLRPPRDRPRHCSRRAPSPPSPPAADRDRSGTGA